MVVKNFDIPSADPLLKTSSKASFQISRTGLQVVKGQLFNVQEPEFDEPIGTGPLGTPIYDDITFPAGRYADLSGSIIDYEEVVLQNVLIVANRAKNVIKTPVQGRDGTVKEYISAGDYIINVSGQIVSSTNTYPEVEVEAFAALTEANAPLPVVSSFLNDSLDVQNLVVESHSIGQIRGSRSQVSISIQAVSDVDIELEELIIE